MLLDDDVLNVVMLRVAESRMKAAAKPLKLYDSC